MSFRTLCGAMACAVISTVSAGNAGDTIARIVLDQARPVPRKDSNS
jgi:hypothetical protein